MNLNGGDEDSGSGSLRNKRPEKRMMVMVVVGGWWDSGDEVRGGRR